MGLLEWCRLPRQYVTLGIVNGITLVMIEYNIFDNVSHGAHQACCASEKLYSTAD